MNWQSIALITAVAVPFAVAFAPTVATPVRASEPQRISGPFVHENLAVYFIHGTSVPGPVPLTLSEALAAGKVAVHETGKVNELSIENTGGEEVFVQAGDIVKGGQQDRVLTVSFLVPANSGRMPIGAFCVEQGRWSARGKEDVRTFSSADKAVPSREAKLAMMAPAKPQASSPASAGIAQRRPTSGIDATNIASSRVQSSSSGSSDGGSGQSGVWSSVARAQSKLSANIGDNVAAGASASSLQLSLENKRLDETRRAFIERLKPAGDAGHDIVGYVLAVGAKLNSGDVYPSNGLFRKMWAKQIEAGATEAIAEKSTQATAAPGIEEVRAFIARAEAGHASLQKVDGAAFVREVRDADAALFLETRRASGGFVHRSYLAR